ncbi:hypothetical protein CCY99_07985 [Helicobacter sp. 16-1353]|uniref:hypothetical protein n=1 Tax=Helicobacter sp. 16-1353 TaxID=2004996 RepID=UPI000DCB3D05|nr:hypothetical protein [Helicobacter sp. 16-1353]RAX52078.1 hypothetical protein CCY99_07985 [Helicobacter sp. 16-1353]
MQIKQFIKKFIPQFMLDKKIHISKQIANFRTLSTQYAQYQSIVKWSCVDKNGNPIPWYTYPAIEFLGNLDFSKKNILEYGSGNSSLFWAKRAKMVVSIENDREWFKEVASKKLPNQEIYLIENNSKGNMGGGSR